MSPNHTASVSLALSPLLSINSSSWVIVWSILEINIVSFTALNTENVNDSSNNETIGILNYFLIQSLASAIIILTIMYSQNNDHNWSSNVLVIVVMTNIAAAPIHRWFIDLINTTSINNSIFLMTWQNSIPLLIITITANELTWLFVVTSAILPTIEIINTLNTLEIFALSSVFNNSWLLTGSQLSTTITLVFTFLYWSAVISLMNEMNNSTSINSSTPSTGNVTITFLANLSSLPPTTGFAANWLLSINIINTGLLTQTTALMLTSLINIYSYIRLCSSNLTGVNNGNNNNNPINNVILLASISTIYTL